LAANLTVLVGLVFLVVEINQNNEMMRAQTRSGITDAIIDNVKMYMDPRVIVAYQKRRRGQPLTDEESALLNSLASATLRLWENTHYQYRNGLFDDAEFEADLAVWREEMEKTEFKLHWSSSRHTYSEAFRTQIDEIVE
jgi:hypothetical protein